METETLTATGPLGYFPIQIREAKRDARNLRSAIKGIESVMAGVEDPVIFINEALRLEAFEEALAAAEEISRG